MGILGLLLLVFAGLYFTAGPAKVEEVDPNAPWAAPVKATDPSEEKLAGHGDPRKISDIVLQKDYCAAGEYFNHGKNAGKLPGLLEQMLEGEAGKAISPDDKLILQALLTRDLDSAIQKLRKASTWQGKMVLSMLLAGTIDPFHSFHGTERTREQLQEALVAIDQAEDLNWENGWVPVYRYLVMRKRDGDGPGLHQFLKDELAKRSRLENPFTSAKVAFGRLRAQDPLYFAATLWPAQKLLAGTVSDGMRTLEQAAEKDPEAARISLRLTESWHRSTIALANEGFSDPVVGPLDTGDALHLGAKLWKTAHPNQPLPDRFRELPAEVHRRMSDRNPSEADQFGWVNGYLKPCGPKWKEAIDNDTELLRDRLRKYEELQRSRR